MASLKLLILFTCALLFFPIDAQTTSASSRPSALVLQVIKDPSTRQYFTLFLQRTPFEIVDLTIDLGGQFMWLDCQNKYNSSTYRYARCGSAQCSLARANGCSQCFSPPRPGCNNNTCGVSPDNTVTRTATGGELGDDIIALQTTDGKNPVKVIRVPKVIFSCAPTSLLQGLAKDAVGMVGLGRTRVSLVSQFASRFNFSRKFAICLASKYLNGERGVVFFGDSPYVFSPNVDVSRSLTYTPLFVNPVSTASASTQGEPSSEYFIGVKAIKINEKAVSLNTNLLSIDNLGFGGTKISTVSPYTVMERSIYRAVSEAFVKAAMTMNLTRVGSVAPFGVCFSSKNIGSTRVGPAVPTIDLVLQSESVFWRIFGANSMVEVRKDVLCLGFVDGGERPRTSIVIGGHQLEDNLLQFDLARSRVGFSSSLLFRQTSCSNFNFTAIED